MGLPIRTTMADVEAICGYLFTKPIGASAAEAKAVLDSKVLDGRKLSAYKFWGLIEDDGEKIRITDRGRRVAKDGGAYKAAALLEAVASVPPYRAAIEKAVHAGEFTLTATEVASHWHQHFKGQVSDKEKTINDQVMCFFHLAQGSDLGTFTIGRKGQSTRLELNEGNAKAFIGSPAVARGDAATKVQTPGQPGRGDERGEVASNEDVPSGEESIRQIPEGQKRLNRVFITHGKNKKILDQVKEIVGFGKFEPVVAQERETAAKPVPTKVMEAMRSCQAAVIHIGSEGVLYDEERNPHPQINGNVLIEIGAAMALYGNNFVLLVEEGVDLPTNLQGLYECRYSGDELNMPATMKLLKAFNEFR